MKLIDYLKEVVTINALRYDISLLIMNKCRSFVVVL